MRFSESIPEGVLSNPHAQAFLNVMDLLQEEKQRIISESLRVHNPVLCNNRRWLVRYLSDFGVFGVPEVFPVGCLQQLCLNLDSILWLKGTLSGLELFCRAAILGTAEVDTSNFLRSFNFLLLDSLYDGYLTDRDDEDSFRYLIDVNELNGQSSLGIILRSKVFRECSEKDITEILIFMKGFINDYVGFHPGCTINITTETLTEYVYPQDFNKYFI